MRNASSPAWSSIGIALISAALAVGVFALIPFSSIGAADPKAARLASERLPGGARVAAELKGERTATSRTYQLDDGRRLTKLYMRDVNYRDAQGDWKPIDTSLVPGDGGGLEVAGAEYQLELPKSSAGRVRVIKGDKWVSFGLPGKEGVVSEPRGATATYADVVPGVDVDYTALADGVKESFVLANRDAPARFSTALGVADGLRPVARRPGAIDLVGVNGKTAMSIAAPFMRDAAGAVSQAVDYRLEAGGSRLTLAADEAWLDDPARKYPVEVDPSVSVAPNPDCTLDAATPTTSLCGGSELEIGWNGTTDRRAAMKFDLSAVPKSANVEYAYMAMYMRTKTTSASKDLAIYRMTRDWTSAASWNRYDGTNNWTTAGGDFDSSRWWAKSQLGTPPPGSYYFFGLTELIQGWVNGTFANQGLIVKDLQNNTTNNVLRFGSTEQSGTSQDPYIGITWDYRLGAQRQFALDKQGLSDRSQLAVNVANGNLIYRGDDLRIAGTGLDLGVSSVYNSLGSLYGPLISGKQWNYSAGGGIFLWYGTSTSRILSGPTGERRVFYQQPDGSWKSPTGMDATLTPDGSGWKLHFDKTAIDWRFNSDGDLTSQKDRNGNEITYTYSSPSKLNHITDTQGRTISTSYYGSGRLHTLSDWAGRTWTYGYDGSDRLTSYIDPDNKTTSFTYTGGDDLATITDPRGKVTKLEYDGNSRITAIKRNYVQATNTSTAKTSYAYSSPTSPCTSTTDVGKTVVTDPRAHDTTYCYDHEARVTKVVDANGNTRTSTYTANSDPDTTTAPGPVSTTRAYTSNNLTSLTEPAGEVTSMQYTNSSFPRFLTQATNPQGTITNYDYDTSGNLSGVRDNGSPTPQVQAKLEYNGQSGGTCTSFDDPSTHPGTLRCVIDGNSNVTGYEYDDDGNLTHIVPASPLGDINITYDSLSRVDTVEDGKGATRSMTYDPLDRVTQIEYSNGETIDYDYDENGNLLERDDSVQGVSTYTYDALNRRTQDTLLSGTTTYGWDAGSNLTLLTDPGGTVTYRYDLVDRLQDLAEPGGSCTTPVSLCTTFGYTARDQRNSTAYPNGVTQSVTYDTSDKPTNITAVKAGAPPTTLTNFTYDYGLTPSGQGKRLNWVTDKNGNKTTFGYDALERLTSAIEKNSGGTTIDTRSYAYDNASNLLDRTFNGSTVSYAYNAANQLCWYKGGGSLTHNCLSPPSGVETFTYDANGNMTGASNGLDFDYNIRDQTTGWTPPGGSATAFGYAGAGQTERTSIGATAQHNTILGLSRQGTTGWTRDPAGVLISQNAGGTRHYYLADRLGSIVGLTDSSGTLVQSYSYDPYGLTKASSGSVSNSFQFTGAHAYFAGSQALYKMGARYYWQGDGRWFQADPFAQPEDLRNGNRYTYAAADPVNFVDPSGLIGIPDIPNPVDVAKCAGAVAVTATIGGKIYKTVKALGGIKDAAILLVKAGSPSDFIEAAGTGGAAILGIDAIRENCF